MNEEKNTLRGLITEEVITKKILEVAAVSQDVKEIPRGTQWEDEAIAEENLQDEQAGEKKQRGGKRPGAGRKPKALPETFTGEKDKDGNEIHNPVELPEEESGDMMIDLVNWFVVPLVCWVLNFVSERFGKKKKLDINSDAVIITGEQVEFLQKYKPEALPEDIKPTWAKYRLMVAGMYVRNIFKFITGT